MEKLMLCGQKGKSKYELRMEREAHRRERGKWEMERMIARYNSECGECKIIRPANLPDKIKNK